MRHLVAILALSLGLADSVALAQSDGAVIQPVDPDFPGRVLIAPVPRAKESPPAAVSAEDDRGAAIGLDAQGPSTGTLAEVEAAAATAEAGADDAPAAETIAAGGPDSTTATAADEAAGAAEAAAIPATGEDIAGAGPDAIARDEDGGLAATGESDDAAAVGGILSATGAGRTAAGAAGDGEAAGIGAVIAATRTGAADAGPPATGPAIAAETGPGDPAQPADVADTPAAITVSELPTVLRPNATIRGGDDAGDVDDDTGVRVIRRDSTGETAGAEDTRFVRVPDRTYGFDPDAPSPVAPIRAPETLLQRGARLRQLDKMTGIIQTYDIAVGETRQVERLKIRLDACRSPDDNDTHGTMAFMKIWDTKRPDAAAAFSGWMFADSPALSALDHPRYDLWVIMCTTLSGETSAASE